MSAHRLPLVAAAGAALAIAVIALAGRRTAPDGIAHPPRERSASPMPLPSPPVPGSSQETFLWLRDALAQGDLARADAQWAEFKRHGREWSPELRARLRTESDPEARTLAALALGKTGDPGAIPDLRAAAFADADGGVRIAAMKALGSLEGGAGALAEVLRSDPEPRVALAAAAELGGADPTVAVPALLERLERPGDPDVRERAAESLGRAATPEALDGLTRTALDDRAERPLRRRCLEVAGRVPGKGEDALKAFLSTAQDAGLRIQAVQVLGTLKTPSARALLDLVRLGDRDDAVRRAAGRALDPAKGR